MLVGALAPARAAEAYAADPKLIEAARREGEVVLYTTLIVDQVVRPMIKAFRAQIPGIDVKFVRTDSAQQVVKLITEGRAGRVQADIWHVSDELAPLLQENLVAPLDLPNAHGLPDTDRSATALGGHQPLHPLDRLQHPARSGSAGAAHLQGPARPALEGQDRLESEDHRRRLRLHRHGDRSMGDEAGLSYLRELAQAGHRAAADRVRAVLDRVIAGEYAIGLEMNNTHAAISAAHGAPVRWRPSIARARRCRRPASAGRAASECRPGCSSIS